MGLIDDVRALGVGAPLRAGYELSKRYGGHTVVFGGLARRPAPPRRLRLPDVPGAVPSPVAQRTLAHARRIAAGDVEIFGRLLPVGAEPDWHSLVERDGRWPEAPWWRIDIRSDARPADVKWTWELGRFRHVVILARACHLDPDDAELADALVRHVRSFLDQNPFERGVHWYSNLELALRAFAFVQVVALAERTLGPELVDRISSLLWHTGRHLVADLPYTVSTMRNNHLLGDGVGLVVIGRAFGDSRFGRRLVTAGDRLVDRFVEHACRPDGSLIEDSVSYHRFVVEILTVRVLAGGASADVRQRLLRAAQFLARLGALEGPVPQYGDWDEGRALTTADDPCLLGGSVLAALAVSGSGAPAAWRERWDEVAWYVGEGEPIPPDDAERAGRGVGGGLARLICDDLTVFLKTAAGHSHQHADATSLAVFAGPHAIVGDPGTGTYNGELERRNWFRSSGAHSVLCVAGEDQLVPLRAFRWKHAARGGLGRPLRVDGTTVLWCWHDAYRRLDPPVRVVRTVLVSAAGVAVGDWLDSEVDGTVALPLGPDVGCNAARELTSPAGTWALSVPADARPVRGSADPFDGWWSATYGGMEPSTVLRWSVRGRGPHAWSLGAGAAERDGALCQGDVAVRVFFEPGSVRVTATGVGASASDQERTS